MRIKLFIFFVIGTFCGLLACCGCQNFPPQVYKIDLKQGVKHSKKTVQKIKPGMTRESVKEILGPPSVVSVLNRHKWYYTYSETCRNQREILRQKFIIFFKNDRVDRVLICEL